MNLKKFYIIGIVIFFSVFIPLFAQTKFIEKFYGDNLSQKYTIERWSTDNGLPQNSVNAITQTPDGFLWLATEEGVVRFDGKNFTIFTIANTPGLKFSRIRTIAGDSSGGVWIGGESGDIAYLKNNIATDFHSKLPLNLGPIRGIAGGQKGDVIFYAGNNLLKFNGKDFITIHWKENKHGFIKKVYAFDNGEFLFSGLEGLYKVDSLGTIKTLEKDISSVVLIPLNQTELLIEDRNQLKVFSLETNRIIREVSKQREINSYENLLIDKQGNIWWGTYDLGLHIISNSFKETKFDHPVLNRTMVTALFEDNSGNIWVGTNTKGLFKLSHRFFYGISLYNGSFNDMINQICQRRNGSVWVASNCSGIAEITKNSVNYYFGGKEGKNRSCVWSIYETSDQSLYFGTYGTGVFKFAPNSYESERVTGVNSSFAFFEDGDSIWVAGVYGLYFIKKDTVTLFKSKVINEESWINTIVKDKNGIIWLGGKTGLYKQNGNDFEKISLLDTIEKIPVRPIYFDENNRMFVGTYGYGMFVSDSGKFRNIKSSDGLFDNTIHTFFEDSKHILWMTSNHGVFAVKKEEALAFVSGELSEINSRIFTKGAGFANNEFNGGFQPAHQYLDDGTLLLPSIDGIVAVDVNNIEFNDISPNVIIDRFLIDGRPYFTNRDEIIVHPGYKDIEIKFAATDLSGVGGIKYKYIIEGLDEGWSRPNGENKILLKAVSPGSYVLKVKAKNSSSKWSDASGELRFTVEPTFFQTLAFKILIVVLIILIVFGIIYFYTNIQRRISKRLAVIVEERTNELKEEVVKKENALKELEKAKEKEERHRKMAEKLNHDKTEMLRIISHNLKNPIGVIRSSANMINDNEIEEEVKNELRDIILKASDEAIAGIEEILHHSEVEDLEFKLSLSEFNFCDLVERVIDRNKRLANEKEQNIIFEINGKSEFFITADYEKLVLAVDNFLSNAIKYSPINEKIEVKVKQKEKELYFSVIDNGPGITEDDKKDLFGKFKKLSARPTGNESSSGLGLSIVKRIIELHNGKVGVISDENKKGAEFFFIIPVSQS